MMPRSSSLIEQKRRWAADTRAWMADMLARVPALWQRRVVSEYERRAKQREADGNRWLREVTESMQGLLLPISATDDDIRARAKDLADLCLRTCGAVTNGSVIARYEKAVRFCECRGIEAPELRLPSVLVPHELARHLGKRTVSTSWNDLPQVQDFEPCMLAVVLPLLVAMLSLDEGKDASAWDDEVPAASPSCYSIEQLVVLVGLEAVRAALNEEAAPALARMMDELWWRRRLREQHGRLIEQHAIGLGYVHANGEKYVSDIACLRRDQQKRRNAQALEAVDVVNQYGECFSLADLAERSNANPRIRRSELMTRIAGFEAVARDLGHVAEFVTLTAPSRFHANGGANPRYDGSSPREAQAWLCKTWQLIRAWVARRGIRFYGFRVAEPHQDGCPHWHLLLFMPKEAVARFRAKFRRYAMRVEADDIALPPTVQELAAQNKADGMKRGFAKLAREQFAQAAHQYKAAIRQREEADRDRKLHGCKFVSVEMSATKSAAGYIAKYISKNIDGYNVQLDLYGHDAVEGAARIEAWAATHNTRQFQQIGGAPVGVWRELRRLREADAEATDTLEAARAAADVGAWSEYTTIQGGPTVERKHLRLKLAKTREGERWDAANQCPAPVLPGRYGEDPGPAVFGVMDRLKERSVITRFLSWTVQRQPTNTRPAQGIKQSAGQQMVSDTTNAWRLPPGKGESPVAWVYGSAESAGLEGFGVDVEELGVGGFGVPWTRVNNCTAPRVGEAESEGVNDEIDRFEPANFKADHDDWEQYDRAVGFLYPGGGGEYLD